MLVNYQLVLYLGKNVIFFLLKLNLTIKSNRKRDLERSQYIRELFYTTDVIMKCTYNFVYVILN